MRILLIHNFPQFWGGIDAYVTSYAELLKKNGHEVFIFKKESKDLKNWRDKLSCTLNFIYDQKIRNEISQIMKEFKPQIVHIHNIYPLMTPTVYLVCKEHQVPIIQHIHDYRFMCPKGMLFRNGKICELCIKKRFPIWSIPFSCYHNSLFASIIFALAFYFHKRKGTFNLIDKFLFPADFVKSYYVNNQYISEDKAQVVPYFVANHNYKQKIRFKNKDFFLFVGRLSEEKGILPLLKIFKSLKNIPLTVIGDGPLKNTIQKQYFGYKNISILGFKNAKEVNSYTKSAYYLIIPSQWYETGPLVAIESIKNTVPIIIPKKGSFQQGFTTSKNGVIFYPFNDWKKLKTILIHLWKKKDEPRETPHIHPKYSSRNHYLMMVEIYKNLSKNEER